MRFVLAAVSGMLLAWLLGASSAGANPSCKLKIVWEDVTINASNGEFGAQQWYFEAAATIGFTNQPNPGALKIPPPIPPGWKPTFRHPAAPGTINPPSFPHTVAVGLVIYDKGTVLNNNLMGLSFYAVATEEDALADDTFSNDVHETRFCVDSSDGNVFLPVNNQGGGLFGGNIDVTFRFSVTFG